MNSQSLFLLFILSTLNIFPLLFIYNLPSLLFFIGYNLKDNILYSDSE